MRVAIYGSGAMGTILGAYIARSGKQVDLITRNRKHVEKLNADGAKITGSVNFVQPVRALTPDEMSGEYDIIFLMTKQRENAAICAFIKPFVAPDGVVCTMQNGLPEGGVAGIIGEERTLGCAVGWGATFVGAGEVMLTSDKRALTFALGSVIAGHEKLPAVKSYLDCMGKVEIVNNLWGARWAKLAINCAFSSLSAITGLTFGELARGKKTRELALELMNEAFYAARKCGIKVGKIQGRDVEKVFSCNGGLKRKFALAIMPFAMRKHKNLISGMYFDLKNGRKSDVNYINGAVAKSGRRFGAKTPLNIKVIAVAHNVEKGELAASPDNVKLLFE